jgi:hypothetical protein
MAVSDAQVKTVVDTAIDTTPLISIATTIVTDVLGDEGFDTAKTDNIILFLSAHLVVLRDEVGGLRRSRLGEADESYRTPGDKSEGFASTRYGQMAMMLDTSGKLAAMNSSARTLRAQFKVEGSRIDEFGVETP